MYLLNLLCVRACVRACVCVCSYLDKNKLLVCFTYTFICFTYTFICDIVLTFSGSCQLPQPLFGKYEEDMDTDLLIHGNKVPI